MEELSLNSSYCCISKSHAKQNPAWLICTESAQHLCVYPNQSWIKLTAHIYNIDTHSLYSRFLI